jgi:hypothetical protein
MSDLVEKIICSMFWWLTVTISTNHVCVRNKTDSFVNVSYQNDPQSLHLGKYRATEYEKASNKLNPLQSSIDGRHPGVVECRKGSSRRHLGTLL